ncbi:MAG: hypothetical protein HQK62_12195 [Desulfamplus sp.]|nr:hypothetical protein [Desulfamplus sp.]
MKIFINMSLVILCFISFSNVSAQEMSIAEELLQRQENAARDLQENQRSRAYELREIQKERASELQEYQEEATENLNQVDVRKYRKRERSQEKVFDHRPVFKDGLGTYDRKTKKSF